MTRGRTGRTGGRCGAAAVLALLAAMGAWLAQGCKPGGTTTSTAPASAVVLYCAADQDMAEPILKLFQERTGIRVVTRFDTEASKTVGLFERIRSEAGAPSADVFWSGEIFHTIRLANEGLLADHQSPALADWPVEFRDAAHRWYGMAMRARMIAYNSRLVSDTEAPKSLEDVLDPKWKGQIVMARPQFGTTGGDVASWFVQFGPRRAREILAALRANQVRLVDGNSLAVRMVANGQAKVCFTDTDDVYAQQRNNQPIKAVPLDRGGAGTLVVPHTVALVRGAPHPSDAGKLIEFLLSDEVERLLAQSEAHTLPVRPALRAEFAGHAFGKPLQIDYNKVAEAMNSSLAEALPILEGR